MGEIGRNRRWVVWWWIRGKWLPQVTTPLVLLRKVVPWKEWADAWRICDVGGLRMRLHALCAVSDWLVNMAKRQWSMDLDWRLAGPLMDKGSAGL